jgi:hypothetical protein
MMTRDVCTTQHEPCGFAGIAAAACAVWLASVSLC